MKVLLVHHDFLPAARAGSELYTYSLGKELLRLGMKVELFHGEKAPVRQVIRKIWDDIACTVVQKPLPSFENLFHEEDLWVDQAFAECLDRFDPDIVHIGHLLQLSVNIPRIAASRRVPVVFTLHDYWLRCPRVTLLTNSEGLCREATIRDCATCCGEFYLARPIYPSRSGVKGVLDRGKSAVKMGLAMVNGELAAGQNQLLQREAKMRALQKYVDCWIAPSQFLRDRMVEWGLLTEKTVFIRYGMLGLGYGRRELRNTQGPLKFGFIGTISRHKGVHILLEAFRNIVGAELIIYGRPTSLLDEFVDVLNQGNVEARGVLHDENKPSAFQELDALVVPSIWFENSPLVIQEAILAGVPVLCSDIGGMKELVESGVDGYHFSVGSPVSLRRLIQRCIEDAVQFRALCPQSVVPSISDQVEKHLIPLYHRLLRKEKLHATFANLF
jgi:glycosyltransferase involved in cell wall biosynthesis